MIVASIDIGTNTVLMLIAEIIDNKLITLRNEHSIPRIGKGVTNGRNISENKIQELLEILSKYKQIALDMNSEDIICIGTNALRIADNRDYITDKVFKKTGINIKIIPGEIEAVYSFLGATEGNSKENNLIIDIGGGSTEIVYGSKKELIYNKSFPVGVVTGTEKFFSEDPPSPEQILTFKNFLTYTFKNIPGELKNPLQCIAIAGTPTTLACINQNLTEYNEDKIEGSIISNYELDNLTTQLSKLSSHQILQKYKAVTAGREDVLLSGTIILQQLMNTLNINQIKVSTKGIRYGAIYYNYIFKDEYS